MPSTLRNRIAEVAMRANLTFVQDMPFPIAYHYHVIEAAHSSATRYKSLIDCYEVIVHFCATVQVSAYLAVNCPDNGINHHLLSALRMKPVTGKRVELVRMITAFQNRHSTEMFLPEMVRFYFKTGSGGGHTSASIVFEDTLLNARNYFVHDGMTLTERDYVRLFDRDQPHLEALLKSLEFFVDYVLYIPHVIKGSRINEAFVLRGAYDPPILKREMDLRVNEQVRAHLSDYDRSAILVAKQNADRQLILCPLSTFTAAEGEEGFFLFNQCRFKRDKVSRLFYRAFRAGQGALEVVPDSEHEHLLQDFENIVVRLAKESSSTELPARSDIAMPLRRLADERRRGLASLAAIGLIILLLLGYALLGPRLEIPRAIVEQLVFGHKWIGYDPSTFNPRLDHNPSIESIGQDLDQIREAGFTGVVTFGSHGTLASIPSLAKQRGLAVIMGIWNPNDQKEVLIAARETYFVDGYCVGHNHSNKPKGYALGEVEHTARVVRKLTGRPVTTTEEARFYPDNERLCRIGDWLFPDMHQPLWDAPGRPARVNVEEDVTDVFEAAKRMVTVAQLVDHRPLMLKNVSYPWNGARGASPKTQEQFFLLLRQTFEDPRRGLPHRVALMVNSSFDSPWKGDGNFYSWDAFTGLLKLNGEPRPAVQAILQEKK